MTAHAKCTHSATPRARRTCREMRAVAASAARWGLKIKNTSNEAVAQLTFVESEDTWWTTRIVWTRHYESVSFQFSVVQSTRTIEARGRRHLISWLKTISNQP